MKHNSEYELEVLVNDKPVFEYHKNDKTFIEGRKNSNYSIRVRNNSNKKILAVLSVDGLSVLDGEEAAPESKGYVVPAYNAILIPGWTLDSNNIAAFEFGEKAESYKAKSDHNTSKGTGVIGCLIYPEKIKFEPYVAPVPFYDYWHPWPYYPPGARGSGHYYPSGPIKGPLYNTSNITNSISSQQAILGSSAMGNVNQANLSANAAPFEMGTKFGEQQEFKTRTVEFERDTDNMVVMQLYYDSRKGLINRGIRVAPVAKKEELPQAFKNIGCKPPADWS